MLRRAFLVVLTLMYVAGAAVAAEPRSAEAAKQSFDELRAQWHALMGQMQEKMTALAAPGPDRGALEQEMADLQKQSEGLVSQIVDAGLEVFQADPNAYPLVNETLVAIAGFHVTGDPHGDGGDQFEKALPIIQALLDKGAGKKWPELWVWGGVSAYCTNQFDLAEKYFQQASQAGLLQGAGGGRPSEFHQRFREFAARSLQDLPALRKAWEKEEKIRAAEQAANDLPQVRLTTTRGDIEIELFENEAPQSVANFLTLVKQGYYNGVPFHRVLPTFMAQGGDPTGTGTGGPGYNIADEHNLPNHRQHFRGSLSMANTGRPNSGGSQFFLTFVPTSYLDGRHAVFGRVIKGMDVAASLKRRDPDTPGGAADKILDAQVIRDRGHEYKFEKFPE